MSKSCPKCGGRMEQGFVATTSPNGNAVTRWIEGAPQKSIWTGVKVKGRRSMKIEIWRCGRCAYLESYAPDA